MKIEVEKLEIIKNEEKGTFEVKLDGTSINGVQKYKLESSGDHGEPELTLVLNIKDFKVAIE